jgi:hypothetical protein
MILGENVFWIIINIIILRSAWQDHIWNGQLRLIIIKHINGGKVLIKKLLIMAKKKRRSK